MKLVRFGDRNCEKPGVLHLNGHRLDLSGHFQDWNPDFFARNGIQRLAEILQSRETTLPCVAATERWAAPVARPGKIICIGLNYSDHASESGMPIPHIGALCGESSGPHAAWLTARMVNQ